MVKQRVFSFFIGIAIPLITATVFSQQIVEEKVIIKNIVGNVEIYSKENTRGRQARIGMILKSGWDVRTYIESEAILEFETGTILRIGENSVVTLSTILLNKNLNNATRSKVTVTSGELWGNVKKLVDNRSQFKFETPTATASIRGTRFGLRVTKEQTRLDVYKGMVAFKRQGSAAEITVAANTRAIVKEGNEQIELYHFSKESGKDSVFAGQDAFVDPFVSEQGASDKDTSISSDTSKGVGLKLEILYPKDGQLTTEKQAVIGGVTHPGAVVFVANKEVGVGNDGLFSAIVSLSKGTNSIRITAIHAEQTAEKIIVLEYQPSVELSILNAIDNMEVATAEYSLDIEVSEGAQFSVNGVIGRNRINLKPGPNVITVKAWDASGNIAEKSLTIIYRAEIKDALFISSPPNGAVVEKPEIVVSGITLPSAIVNINNFEVVAGPTGAFKYMVNIPDEPGQYVIHISVSAGNSELSQERTVTYRPPKIPLSLTVTSPANGQKIVQNLVRISGKTSPQATLTVNDRPVKVLPTGLFLSELILSERDIGIYPLEFNASDNSEEITKTINVLLDITSAQLNTSIPTVQLQGQLVKATRGGKLAFSVLDRTPDDQLQFVFINNDSREEYSLESGERQVVELDEGKNTFTSYAYDLAGNMSNIVQGTIYYLPGPLAIRFRKPMTNPHIIRGLPPLPRNVGNPVLELEIEVDDNIGNVPETIKYCRIRGNGQDMLLKNNNDYTFEGEVELTIGQPNVFTVIVEDIAGTVQTAVLTVLFSR